MALSIAEISTAGAIAVGIGSALLGAIATGLFSVLMWASDRAASKRVAARSMLGDVYVTQKGFELLLERDEWFYLDFNPVMVTWREHRADLARELSMADWSDIDAFYNNLGRTAALAKPHQKPTNGDRRAAQAQIDYAGDAAKALIEHVPRGKKIPLPKWTPDWIANLLSKRQREISGAIKRAEKQAQAAVEEMEEGEGGEA